MRKALFAIELAAIWSPLAALLLLGREPVRLAPMSARQLGLLGQSLGYALAVGVLCSVLGFLAALRLWRVGASKRFAVQGLLVALIALPPTVLAAGWMGFSGDFGRFWTQGWAPTVLIQSLALTPLATCIIALSLERLDGDVLDAARTAKPPQRQFWQVLVPLMWPALAASMSLTGLVALGDFTIPSLFSANPFALEIFAMFSAGEDAVSSSWPLVLLSLPLAWVAGRWTSTLVANRGPRPSSCLEAPLSIGALARLAALAVGLVFLSAGLLLVLQSRSPAEAAAAAASSSDELWVSIRFAGIGALLSAALGLLAAPTLAHSSKPIAWALVLAPVALPPALVGMGLARIGVWASRYGDAGAFLSLAPALASAIRFAPFAAAILALEWARVDPLVVDAGRTFAPPIKRAARIWLPLLSGGLVGGFSLSFALGLGELGATLLVVPPGQSTLSIRLYNLLHYGASEDVAALALMLVALTFAAAIVSGWAMRRIRLRGLR